MRRLVAIAVATVGLSLAASAQQPVFRASAQTVSVYATVRDRAGHLVPGLTRADFQVLDDGHAATVTTFSDDVVPTTMALMLDMSASMVGEHLRVRDAALHFIDALLPSDRVRIGTFGDEIALSPWLTSDKATLGRILREEVWPGGSTPLWSAMHAGMTSIAAEPGRRVIVVLTDGIDTGCPRMIGTNLPRTSMTLVSDEIVAPQERGREPWQIWQGDPAHCTSFIQVEELSVSAEFMVYAIGMEGSGLGIGLSALSDETGGGHFDLKQNADLSAAFAAVADELHHQYAIGFTAVALDGRTHLLDVRLRRPGLVARARKSYVAVDR